MTVSPIFLPKAPDMNPRTEWACQPVAFMISLTVAPPDRRRRFRTLAALLSWREQDAFFGDLANLAALFGCFARLAFLPNTGLEAATWGFCAVARAFLGAF